MLLTDEDGTIYELGAVELHFSAVVSLGKRILTFYSVETVNMKVYSVTIQSAIRKKMAPRVAFRVDRHNGLKLTVFVWESDGK